MKRKVEILMLLHRYLTRTDIKISTERSRAINAYLITGNLREAGILVKRNYDTIVKHVIHSIFEQKFGAKIGEI